MADLKKPDRDRPDKENHFEALLKKDNRTKSLLEKIEKLKEQTKDVEWGSGVVLDFEDWRKDWLNKIENKTERKMVRASHVSNHSSIIMRQVPGRA